MSLRVGGAGAAARPAKRAVVSERCISRVGGEGAGFSGELPFPDLSSMCCLMAGE